MDSICLTSVSDTVSGSFEKSSTYCCTLATSAALTGWATCRAASLIPTTQCVKCFCEVLERRRGTKILHVLPYYRCKAQVTYQRLLELHLAVFPPIGFIKRSAEQAVLLRSCKGKGPIAIRNPTPPPNMARFQDTSKVMILCEDHRLRSGAGPGHGLDPEPSETNLKGFGLHRMQPEVEETLELSSRNQTQETQM